MPPDQLSEVLRSRLQTPCRYLPTLSGKHRACNGTVTRLNRHRASPQRSIVIFAEARPYKRA